MAREDNAPEVDVELGMPQPVAAANTPTDTPADAVAIDLPEHLSQVPTPTLPNYLRGMAIKILEETFPDDIEEQRRQLLAYDESAPDIIQATQNDINGPGAFNIELEVPDIISEPQLRNFFKGVLNQYSAFARASTENDYALKPKDWFESKPNRARLVLIESTETNLPDIARAFLNASPLERIVAVGLDDQKKADLKAALLVAWGEKIATQAAPDEYRQKVLDVLNENSDTPIRSLSEASLEALLGPNDITTNTSITFENLKEELGSTFYSKIDELILYGENEALAQELPQLLIDTKVQQSLAIKATPFEDDGNSLFWTTALTGVDDPIKQITDAKNPEDILAEGKYQLNPDLERILDAHITENGIQPRDAAFIKEMFTSKSLYINNLSPSLYATTITKAQSGVNGKGSLVVGKALPWALVGRIIATALGARFAVNSTMLDTGNDLQQGDQEKMLSYKDMYAAVLAKALKDNPENAFEEALGQLAKGYAETEKNPEISRIETAAAAGRLHSLVHANKTNKLNEFGIKLLAPSPAFWGYGLVTTIGGVALAATGVNLGIGVPITGASVFATASAITGTSLGAQAIANAYNFVRWHRASGKARGTQKNAQDKRDQQIHNRTELLLKRDNSQSSGIDKGVQTEIEVKQTAEFGIQVDTRKTAAEASTQTAAVEQRTVGMQVGTSRATVETGTQTTITELQEAGTQTEIPQPTLEAEVAAVVDDMISQVETATQSPLQALGSTATQQQQAAEVRGTLSRSQSPKERRGKREKSPSQGK